MGLAGDERGPSARSPRVPHHLRPAPPFFFWPRALLLESLPLPPPFAAPPEDAAVEHSVFRCLPLQIEQTCLRPVWQGS